MLRADSVFLLVLVACWWPSIAVADWPGFRGPSADGHAPPAMVPLDWSAEQNVAWRRPVPGEGWSSPVVQDGRVYLTSAVRVDDDSNDYSLRLRILRASDGELVRDVAVFQQEGDEAPKIHSKNSHASPTPLVHDGHVYAHFGHQGTACLDLDGQLVWRNRSLQYAPVHGNGGSPIVVDDALIFSCDGARDPFIVALNRHTGEEIWRTARPTEATKKFSFSTPTLITVNGRQQVISPGSDVVCAFDPVTGEEIWRLRYDGYSVIPKPVFAHGLVYICTGYNRPSLLAIRPDGAGDITDTHLVWKTNRSVPHTPSLLIVGDELYMVSDNGVASCLDALSSEVHWTERIGRGFSASPVFVDGRIYFQDESGTATVIHPGKTFNLLAENSLDERTLASYAIAENAIFLRTAERLYRIEASR